MRRAFPVLFFLTLPSPVFLLLAHLFILPGFVAAQVTATDYAGAERFLS
jgi:hypothetical protein